MELSGISALSAILKRPVEPRNDALAQRRELSAELQTSCQQLVILLKDSFYRFVPQMSEADFQFSEKKIMDLKADCQHTDGPLQEDDSPILRHLSIDMRFKDFVQSTLDFYKLAQRLKPTLNEYVPDAAALQALSKSEDPTKFIRVLQGELENRLDRVNQEYMKVMALKFSW